MPGDAVRRWAGTGYVPGRFGMWGVKSRLIVVELAGSRLTVRLRPGLIARLFGVAPLVAEPGTGLTITPTLARGGTGRFVWFRLPDERRYAFCATPEDQEDIATCLADAGFEVSEAESG